MYLSKRLSILIVTVGALLVLMADSCDNTGETTKKESQQVSSQQDTYTKNQPVHTYQYSAERDALIQLYDQRTKGNLNTWTVWISDYGTPIDMCPSKGYPIPYGTQLTSPQQIVTAGGTGITTAPQMDPQGAYLPPTAEATWVLCLDPDGSIHPQYVEPKVITYTYPVEIQDGKIIHTGAPSAESKITQNK